MNKKSLIIITVLVIAVLTLGYVFIKYTSPEKNNSTVNETVQESKKQEILTVDGAIEKLKASNFSVGPKRETYYQMIGAYDGTKIDVNNITVELYQYKDAQKEAKEKARETMDAADIIIFENNSLLVVVQSKDAEFANSIKAVLQ